MLLSGLGGSAAAKLAWSGVITSIQPRIRLLRSYDQREHSYQGYVLRVQGTIESQTREFVVAVGEGAHQKHEFRLGDRVSGEGVRVSDPRIETAELYKISKLKLLDRRDPPNHDPPPWHGVPPSLPTYRARGHRRLDSRTYEGKCSQCIWGCRMAVEMIVDQWNPTNRRYRTETFCYGPLSCSLYRAGPTRKVPGRRGMSYTEESWVDDEDTNHRAPDE